MEKLTRVAIVAIFLCLLAIGAMIAVDFAYEREDRLIKKKR